MMNELMMRMLEVRLKVGGRMVENGRMLDGTLGGAVVVVVEMITAEWEGRLGWSLFRPVVFVFLFLRQAKDSTDAKFQIGLPDSHSTAHSGWCDDLSFWGIH